MTSLPPWFWPVPQGIPPVSKPPFNVHNLKTVEPFFTDLLDGRKNFEIRKDDRGFAVGDLLCLLQFNGNYTGFFLYAEVIHIYRRDSILELIPDGYVLMSLKVYRSIVWDRFLQARLHRSTDLKPASAASASSSASA